MFCFGKDGISRYAYAPPTSPPPHLNHKTLQSHKPPCASRLTPLLLLCCSLEAPACPSALALTCGPDSPAWGGGWRAPRDIPPLESTKSGHQARERGPDWPLPSAQSLVCTLHTVILLDRDCGGSPSAKSGLIWL